MRSKHGRLTTSLLWTRRRHFGHGAVDMEPMPYAGNHVAWLLAWRTTCSSQPRRTACLAIFRPDGYRNQIQDDMRREQCCKRGSATSPEPPDISILSCVGLCVAELLPCFIDRSEEDLDPFHTTTAMSILGRLDPAVGKIRRCGVAVSKIPDLWVRQSLASQTTELRYLVPMWFADNKLSQILTPQAIGILRWCTVRANSSPVYIRQATPGLDESLYNNSECISCAEPSADILVNANQTPEVLTRFRRPGRRFLQQSDGASHQRPRRVAHGGSRLQPLV